MNFSKRQIDAPGKRRTVSVARLARELIHEIGTSLASSVPTADIVRIASSLRSNEPIDYDRDAAAFAVAFLHINFEKALSTFKSTPPLASRVIDVGAGPGSSALAYLVHACESGGQIPSSLVVLDRSASQLDIAEEVLGRFIRAMALTGIVNISRLHGDFLDGQIELPKADLVIASHVLTEAGLDLSKAVKTCFHMTRERGELVVIERADDKRPLHAVSTHAKTIWAPQLTMDSSIVAVDPMSGIEREWNSTCILVDSPPQPWLVSLVDRYFEAWRTKNPRLLEVIFDKDCVYSEHENEEQIVGLAAVKEYWLEKVVPQSILQLDAYPLGYTASRAVVHFTASFFKKTIRYDLNGVIQFEGDPRTCRICRVLQWFETNKQS